MGYGKVILRWISYILIGVGVFFEGITGLLSGAVISLFVQGEWFSILFILFSIYGIIFFQIRRKHTSIVREIGSFLKAFFLSYGFGVILLFTSFFVFINYYNSNPGYLSDITLSNGKQKVIFLQMSHIATNSFYTEKRDTLTTLAKTSSVFLVEGVGTGTKESQDIFDRSLGFQFDSDLYPTLARIGGLEVQSGSYLFSGVRSEDMKNIDMSLDEIVGLLSTGTIDSTGIVQEINISRDLALIGELSGQEQRFIQYIFRAFLNWSIINRVDVDQTAFTGKKELFDIILGKRNERVVNYIISNPERDIVVVYGALHFPGIFASLRSHDKNWKIESYTTHTPYRD